MVGPACARHRGGRFNVDSMAENYTRVGTARRRFPVERRRRQTRVTARGDDGAVATHISTCRHYDDAAGINQTINQSFN